MSHHQDGDQPFTVTRRTVLKGAAVTGAAVALSGGGAAVASKTVIRGLADTGKPIAAVAGDEKVISTYCPPNCGGRCVLDCTVRDGRFVKVEPGQHPDPRYTAICVRGLTHPQRVYSPDRIKYPMKRVGERGEGKFERISWEEALDTIAAKLKEASESYEPGSIVFTGTSGGSTTDYGRLAALLKGGFLSGYMASQDRATGIDVGNRQGMILTAGLLTNANEWTDRANARLVISWGNNPAETAMTSMRFLFDAQAAGTKVVVVDPRYSATAMHADWWVHPRPGTDPALAWGMINVIIDEGLVDEEFVLAHTIGPMLIRQTDGKYVQTPLPEEMTAIPPQVLAAALAADPGLAGAFAASYMVWDRAQGKAVPQFEAQDPALTGDYVVDGVPVKTGYQMLKEMAAEYTPEKVEEITGVDAEDVRELGRLYGTLKPSTIGMGYGVDRHYQSHTVGRLVATLGGLTGNIGKPGASVGIASHGSGYRTARLGPDGRKPLPEDAVQTRKVGIKPRVLFSQGDVMNQYYADMNWTKALFEELDFLVTADHFWQTTSLWSDIVLPASTFLESNSDLVDIQSNRNAVILKRKVIDPLWESKPDIDIERGLAERLGFGEYFQDKEEDIIRHQIEGSKDPQMKGITFEQVVAEGGARLNAPPDPNVSNAGLVFTTPTGRIQWYNEEMAPFGEELPVHKDEFEASPNHPLAKKYPLVYTQNHVRQRAHSTYFNSAWTLEVWPEPILEMNPGDAEARGIATGDYVEAFNDRGRAVARAVLNPDYGPGHCNITEGWKQQQFKAGHFQELTNPANNPAFSVLFDYYGMYFPSFAQFGMSTIGFYDTRVEVRKVEV
jgi:molybdopterin-containing oxidoreductase family molybdopterin binding subunit